MLKTRKMKKNSLILLVFIGLLGILTSCEEDGERIIFPDDVIPPTLQALPDLTLERANATDNLIFLGSAVDPGFTASATYFLEACESGTGFEDPVEVITTTDPDTMRITVGQLNSIMLEQFPGDETSSVDFRLRSVLVVDAGPMPGGMAREPMEYISGVTTVNVTLYGLPRLDLVDSGTEQKVVSPNGDGVYSGFVNVTSGNSFTLYNPDNDVTYGGSNGTLSEGGDAITPESDGWHELKVNLNDMSFELNQFSPGVVGEFTGWGGDPDFPMDYDPEAGHWFVTVTLPTGPMKFRLNSDWGVNWGPGGDTDLPANGGKLTLPDSNGNIIITTAGSYTIYLKVSGSSGSVEFILN